MSLKAEDKRHGLKVQEIKAAPARENDNAYANSVTRRPEERRRM